MYLQSGNQAKTVMDTVTQKFEWQPPTIRTNYPKWTYIYVEGEYYLILSKTRKKFISQQAFYSWNAECIIGTKDSVSGYPLAGNVGYRPGTVIRTMNNVFYYVEDEYVRRIADPKFFTVLGFDELNAYDVSDIEFAYHKEGEAISLD